MRVMKCASRAMQVSVGQLYGLLFRSRTRFEQVANLLEQHFRPARRWRNGRRLGLAPHESRRRLTDPEHDEGDDHEIDQGIDEQTDIDGRRRRLLGRLKGWVMLAVQRYEDVAEIDAADRQPDHRVDDVLDEAADDAGEGGADDNADRQIDDVAARDEGAELADPAGLLRQA